MSGGQSVRARLIRFLRKLIRLLSRYQRPEMAGKPLSGALILEACDRACSEKEIFRRKYLSMEMLSREVGTNRTYLKKALSARGGFTSYINGRRLEYAVCLMVSDVDNRLKIGEIAELSGFASERAMNYYVAKTHGIPVREFRRCVMLGQAKNCSTSAIASGRANTATRS